MQRLLGIDFGNKHLGLALTDPSKTIARPFKTIDYNSQTLSVIEKICQEEEVAQIILGLPKSLNGTLGPQGNQVMEFKKQLESKIRIPVILEDERLTTKIAQQLYQTEGKSVKQSREKINELAAQIILESYLERTSNR